MSTVPLPFYALQNLRRSGGRMPPLLVTYGGRVSRPADGAQHRPSVFSDGRGCAASGGSGDPPSVTNQRRRSAA
ncbi:hypothetical protein [Geminisphaera colitermitum]|uniref:hypothetical protein n=1 Tax=Geminisphaera colitermitum TaxID=1148786 RepID=UPI0012FEF22E|nr:hypothetical protein [Geminisphaera colitermitum]